MNDIVDISEVGTEFQEQLGSKLRDQIQDPRVFPSFDQLSSHLNSLPFGSPEHQEWENLCFDKKEAPFEFWTKEYVEKLADYLRTRVEVTPSDKPLTVLELGAGSGKLSYGLQERLNEKIPGKVIIIPTDSGEGMERMEITAKHPMEHKSYKEAIKDHSEADIVILSWPPNGEDWTGDIRAAANVKEYVVIGAPDGGAGDYWRTWGIAETHTTEKPPYEADGFEKVSLTDVQKFQISREKVITGNDGSLTVSFRRNNS